MWISVRPGTRDGELLLPRSAWPGAPPRQARLRYGAAESPVRVRAAGGQADRAGLDQQHPAQALLGPDVMARLNVRPEPVYRLLARGGQGALGPVPGPDPVLELGPVLGLLLGNRNQWYDDRYLSREPERVAAVYPRTGGLFCAFSPRNLSLAERRATGLFYHPGEDRWQFGFLPLPAVVFRRSFCHSQAAIERLRSVRGLTLFNSRRFDKWEQRQIFGQDPGFSEHLPDTARVETAAGVLDMVARHGVVILKPVDLSRGRGIVFVRAGEDGGGYVVHDHRRGGAGRRRDLGQGELERLVTEEIAPRRYLCQQRIELAEVGGAPFDVRLVMQRDTIGRWICQGIECRLAGRGSLVTNISYGGRALLLEEAVGRSFGGRMDAATARERMVELARAACALLEATGETFAELGLDLALDREGRLWFFEANVLPTFRGFQTLDPATYRRLLTAPLRYAGALAGFGEETGAETAGGDSGRDRGRGGNG